MSPRNNAYAKKLALEVLPKFLPVFIGFASASPFATLICSLPSTKLLPPFFFHYITTVIVPRVLLSYLNVLPLKLLWECYKSVDLVGSAEADGKFWEWDALSVCVSMDR